MTHQRMSPPPVAGSGLVSVSVLLGGRKRAHPKASQGHLEDSPPAPAPQQLDYLSEARRIEAVAAVQRGRGQEGMICLAAELRRRAGGSDQ
jgi:hypothetical protein